MSVWRWRTCVTLSWRNSTTFFGPELRTVSRYEASCCCSTMWPAVGGDSAGTDALVGKRNTPIIY